MPGFPLSSWVHRAILGLAAAPLLLGGCEGNTANNNSESVLDLLPAQPTPVDAARWMFDPYDPDKRFRGTVLLANAPFGGESVYIKGYVEHLTDPDASVRAASVFALGQHGSPDQVPLILPLLTQEDRLVRISAVRALQRLHNPIAVPPLLDMLSPAKEADSDVRAEAANALGQYAEGRVLQGLIGALGDDRLAVTTQAAASLHTLTGMNFGDDRAEWFNWAARCADPFDGQLVYLYPVFNRDKSFLEHIPFWPAPPNETAAQPAGMAAGPPTTGS